MATKIFTKYQIMNYQNDYFGSGKSTPVNKRCRRQNKKKAKLQFEKDFK